MKEILSPPTASALMESTRSIGYSFETAISDIIDNSVSAEADNIWIKSIPSEDPYVAILDDGQGLSLSELEEAMRYGVNPNCVRSEMDLGRFGLGLKMASLSQCRRLTVISKTDEGLASCRWDLDHVIATDQWSLQILDVDDIAGCPLFDELIKLSTGTLVIWEDLDKIKERAMSIEKSMTDTITVAREHISLVFHRFMSSKTNPLNIYFNGSKLEPLDPFLSTNSLTVTLPEQTILIKGQQVVISPYVLPPEHRLKPADIKTMGGLKRRMQGFWVYRNKRLIIPGTWFRLSSSKELSKLARVRVDIPNTLDSVWDIDVKKSTATIPDQFRDDFEKILDRVIDRSEQKYKYKGRKANSGNINYIWDKISFKGAYQFKVNLNHPIIKTHMDSLDSDAKAGFIEAMKLVEESLPYQEIYNSMAELQLSRPKSTDKDVKEIISSGIRLMEKGIPFEIIEKTEPFVGCPDALKALKEYKEAE